MDLGPNIRTKYQDIRNYDCKSPSAKQKWNGQPIVGVLIVIGGCDLTLVTAPVPG